MNHRTAKTAKLFAALAVLYRKGATAKTQKSLRFSGITAKTQKFLLRFCDERFCDKGITLIELIIAISLLLLVLAAAMSVDMAGQWFFKSTSVQAEIQDELQPAMEHIIKNIQLANAITLVSSTEVRVWIDDNNTPSDYADDTRVTYEKSAENILYSDTDRGITNESIAKTIANTDIFSLSGISLTIKIKGERIIQGGTESVTLISGVTLRCRRAG